MGWKEVYENRFEEEDAEEDMREQTLPAVNQGDVLKVRSLEQTKGQTKPPAPFTEGTLLTAMENPAKYMDTDNK
jgi:DNA topoisomerase-3